MRPVLAPVEEPLYGGCAYARRARRYVWIKESERHLTRIVCDPHECVWSEVCGRESSHQNVCVRVGVGVLGVRVWSIFLRKDFGRWFSFCLLLVWRVTALVCLIRSFFFFSESDPFFFFILQALMMVSTPIINVSYSINYDGNFPYTCPRR